MSKITFENQWDFWQSALAGQRIEAFGPGFPHSGCYKHRYIDPKTRDGQWEAVMIWWDEKLNVFCASSLGRIITNADRIDEIFARSSDKPITHELFTHISGGGKWPEELDLPQLTIGGNGGPAIVDPKEGWTDKVEALKASVTSTLTPYIEDWKLRFGVIENDRKGWLTLIGDKPQNEDDCRKDASYDEQVVKLRDEVETLRKDLKKPVDELGKIIQGVLPPLHATADTLHKTIENGINGWRREEDRRRQAAAAEAQKAALAAGVPPEAAKIEAVPVKVHGFGGRAVPQRAPKKQLFVTDITKLIDYLRNDEAFWKRPDVLDIVGIVAELRCKAEIAVPGVRYGFPEEVPASVAAE